MGAIPDETSWRSVYQRYTQLERAWSIPDAPEPVARQFFRRVIHGHQNESAILREFRSFRLEPPPSEVLREAFDLQSALYPSEGQRPGGRHPDDPMEDVYAAALSMLPHGFWVESPERDQLYRGQRDANWSTIPTLFRRRDIEGALDELAMAIPRIQACLPAISDEQALAVAQHYSKELKVATWLLDMTYDPRVALFFASDGGVTGDVGLVSCLLRKEWNKLSAAGSNRLGRLRVIDVPGVLRIEHQRASFLDTSHPDLIDQYVAHTVWFLQKEGIRFEDRYADTPITAEWIYPKEDPVLAGILHTPPATTSVLRIAAAGDAREPLSATAYLEIAQSWCRHQGVEIDAYREDVLRAACDVHARLQQHCDQFALPDRSLARLQDAVNLIMQAQSTGQFITLQEAFRWSLSRLQEDRHVLLQEIITDCADARGLCLTSPTKLRERLLELDHRLSGLPGRRVALLGFRDLNAERVDENVRAMCETSEWTVIDLRNTSSVRLPEAFNQALVAPKLAVLIDVAAALPTDASLLIRALHNSQDYVSWSDFTQSELRSERMLYVVAAGARSIEDLPELLQRISFMTFLKALK